MAPDVLAMRQWLHAQIDLPENGTLVDLGCGGGEDLQLFARLRPDARCLGIDLNIPDASGFVQGDIGSPLPVENADVLYSVNAIECLHDKPAALRNWSRALKPDGQLVLAHFDWDTQTFDGPDRDLIRSIVHAYADWQQAWMPAIDPWAGRKLHRWVRESGAFEGEIRTYTLQNHAYEAPLYGHRQAQSFEALVRRNLISAADYQTFRDSLEEQAKNGTYFFSITLFVFIGRKS